MKRRLNVLLNAFHVFKLACKHPQAFDGQNMNSLVNLYTMIVKVASEKRNYMTQLVKAATDEGIINIWMGYGAASCPTKRIEELVEENELLKKALKK